MKATILKEDDSRAVESTACGTVPTVLLLSSSLLTDRMFLHTEFVDVLSRAASVKVWATSAQNPRFKGMWASAPAEVDSFPNVKPFKEFPHNYLRRLNEFTWDFRQLPASRLSMMEHVRKKALPRSIRALRIPARVLALAKMERAFESGLEKLLLGYQRSEDAEKLLLKDPPTILLTTGPFQFEQPAVVAAAKRFGIPTLALIPSWDNLSTKNRMVFKYDGYIVWSEQSKRELWSFYPETVDVPTYVVGAPQFDVFFDDRYTQTRIEFCESQALNAELPIIVYAVGSPNFLQEHHGALELARRLQRGELGDVQIIVRPHPIHDNAQLLDLFRQFAPRVVVQKTADAGTALTARSQDHNQVKEWVNTFRHADVVVNLSSTVTVDAAIFDRPVVNLDFDPEPGQPQQALVKDVNHLWTHFKPIAESGGVWLVNDYQEMINAIRTYLRTPELHRERRAWLVKHICGYIDGRCGARLAQAVLAFSKLQLDNCASGERALGAAQFGGRPSRLIRRSQMVR